jgi:hypothetical protein
MIDWTRPLINIGELTEIAEMAPSILLPERVDWNQAMLSKVDNDYIRLGARPVDHDDLSPYSDNYRRALRAMDSVRAFWGEQGDEEIGTIMGDLLCDLHHLSRMCGIEFDELLRKGEMHYRDELKGELT